MSRGPFNWTHREVVAFLKEHGFSLNYIEGSHYYYVGSHNGFRQVCVPFHGAKVFKPRTLNGMIRQSGIPRDEWMS